jgi:hypothetical protein
MKHIKLFENFNQSELIPVIMGKEKGKKKAQQQQLNIHAVICSTLNDFRNKGAAWQSQIMADKLLMKLKELLPDDEWWKLKIAHSHYLTGEGAEELYEICKELSEKYCI